MQQCITMDGSATLVQPSQRTTTQDKLWPAGCEGNAASRFLPFKDALLHARSLKLKGKNEWCAWTTSGNRPPNVPSNPGATYKHEGWQGYGHWLSTGNLVGGKLDFLPFKKALLQARSLKLKGQTEWKDWAKTGVRPANMPSRPDQFYQHDGWQGYGHWLGTGNDSGGQRLEFMPFKKALVYARCLKLKSVKEWAAWRKSGARPDNVPSNPHKTYRHVGWQGYGHWQHAKYGTVPAVQEGVSAVQEGAALCTLPQAEKPRRMERLGQDWCPACQYALLSR